MLHTLVVRCTVSKGEAQNELSQACKLIICKSWHQLKFKQMRCKEA
jgi:hypothetical protein